MSQVYPERMINGNPTSADLNPYRVVGQRTTANGNVYEVLANGQLGRLLQKGTVNTTGSVSDGGTDAVAKTLEMVQNWTPPTGWSGFAESVEAVGPVLGDIADTDLGTLPATVKDLAKDALSAKGSFNAFPGSVSVDSILPSQHALQTVSYTHLTLPTKA